MKVISGRSFVVFIIYTVGWTASADVSDSETPGNSSVHVTVGPPGDPPGGSSASHNVSKAVEVSDHAIPSVDVLLLEYERKLADLGSKLKQMTDPMATEWSRDTLLHMILSADRSLSNLRQLNLQELPVPIRQQLAKLEQSVENIKTSVYLLIQNEDVQLHNFTGKIGNNSVSLERLWEWVESLSGEVTRLDKTLRGPRENSVKLSEDVAFELAQVYVFVDRIGWEFVPLRLQTKLKELNTTVHEFINRVTRIDENQTNYDLINQKIQSLSTNLTTYIKTNVLPNNAALFQSMKQRLAGIMVEVERPNVPDHLISAAEKLKKEILDAETHYLLSGTFETTAKPAEESVEYEEQLAKLESLLDGINGTLTFRSSTPTLIEMKEKAARVLAESDEMHKKNVSKEVDIKLLWLKERAKKFEKLVTSVIAYLKNPQTVGVDTSLISEDKNVNTNFEDILDVLHQQFEHLENLFYFEHDLEVLLIMKSQTELIIKHLDHLTRLGTTTPLQRNQAEKFLVDIKDFLQHVNTAVERELLTRPVVTTTEPNISHNNHTLKVPQTKSGTSETDSLHISIENFTHRLRDAVVQLNNPLNISSLQDIHDTILKIIIEILVLEESHTASVHQTEIRQIKQRGIEYLLLILLSTQGQIDLTKEYVINDQNNDLRHKIGDLETYFDELQKRIDTLPHALDDSGYINILLTTLRRLQRVNRPQPHEAEDENTRTNITIHHETSTSNQTDGDDSQTNNGRQWKQLVNARFTSLQHYFIQLMDLAFSSGDPSYYEDYMTETVRVLREVQDLQTYTASPTELKSQIHHLLQDIESFRKYIELRQATDRDSRDDKETTNRPVHSPDDQDGGNADLKQTMTNMTHELEVLRAWLPKEHNLTKIEQLNVHVHHIFLELKMMTLKVTNGLRGQVDQLEEMITRLVTDIETKATQIRESQVSPTYPLSRPHTDSSTVRGVDENTRKFNDLRIKIHSLLTDLNTYIKTNVLPNNAALFQSIKQRLAGIMVEVERPNVPDHLISAAEKLKKEILDAETHYLLSGNFDTTAKPVKESVEYEEQLTKLETLLDGINGTLTFRSSIPTLIEMKEKAARVLAESDEMHSKNVSKEFDIKLFWLKERAKKFEKLVTSVITYLKNPQTVGVDTSFISEDKNVNTNVEDILDVLHQQFEHLENLFYFELGLDVLLTMKSQTELIIKHLIHITRLGTTTPSQRKQAEKFLADINYFLLHINSAVEDEERGRRPNVTTQATHTDPVETTESTNPANTFENLKNVLHHAIVQLNYPLNLSSLREIHETIVNVLNDLAVLEKSSSSVVSEVELGEIEQRGMESLLLILLSTEGQTDETKTYIINGKDRDLQHKIHHLDIYFKELHDQLLSNSQINTDYINSLLTVLIRLQRENQSQAHEGEEWTPIENTTPTNPRQPIDNSNNTDSQTTNRNLKLITSQVETLEDYYLQLYANAYNLDATDYDKYNAQTDRMLKVIQTLNTYTGIPKELENKIQDLDQKIRKLKEYLELLWGTVVENQDGSAKVSEPVNPDNGDDGNAELITRMATMKRELEVLGVRLSTEYDLSKINQINVQVLRMLLEVSMMSFTVPNHLRDQIDQLEQAIRGLITDVQTKVAQIKESRGPYYPPQTNTSIDRRIDEVINPFEVSGELENPSDPNPLNKPVLSTLIGQLENLVLEMRQRDLQSGQSSVLILKLIAQHFPCVHDQISEEIKNVGVRDGPKAPEPSQQLTVENGMKQIYQNLIYLSKELDFEHDPLGLNQIGTGVRNVLLDLKNLQALRLPPTFKADVDFLLQMGNDLKIKFDQASALKTQVGVYPLETVYSRTHNVRKELVDLDANLRNIEQIYFSGTHQLGPIQVFVEVSDISNKLLLLKGESLSSDLRKGVDLQQRVASNFLQTVREHILKNILFPIRTEIDFILLRFGQTRVTKPARDEIIEIKQDLLALIESTQSPSVTRNPLSLRDSILDILQRLVAVTERNGGPQLRNKVIATFNRIVETYL